MSNPSLTGIKVVDLSRVLGGPLCTQILGDHGADIIKVEPPAGDETRGWGPPYHERGSAYYDGVNRNKKCIALDMRQTEAHEILFRLLKNADVLVENFKVGTLEKWGIGFNDVLQKKFPRLIHCRVTGFGSNGPYAGFPGYDAVAQATSGLMSINGDPDRPPVRIGVPIVDLTTGMNAVIAVLLALYEREKSGLGQSIEVSLYDTAVSLIHPHAANWFLDGKPQKRLGSAHPNITPYDLFPTANGMLFLGIGNDRQFAGLCKELGQPELAQDPRFTINANRAKNRAELRIILEDLLADRDGKAMTAELMGKGIPAGAVQTVEDALQHPQTIAREMVIESGEYRGTGIPVKLSRTPGAFKFRPPQYGENNTEILADAGYSAEEIKRFKEMQITLEKPRK
ncbi:MAG: carnitine dehydratase [Neptuniibacter sp. Phe_28]|jgi:crotonobetainyl-CoA:carnitine CoA-transferase CaiB-like acyl-CoA transferase|nr:MAG: carnitine dehydratase [Neptuniibacter sp. Phe_28]MEE4291251.1 CoA transferase [Cycloclasticus sp.]